MAFARRKFVDPHTTNKSQIAEKALYYIAALYEFERKVRELKPGLRRQIRLEKGGADNRRTSYQDVAQRQLVPEGVVIAKALEISLKR